MHHSIWLWWWAPGQSDAVAGIAVATSVRRKLMGALFRLRYIDILGICTTRCITYIYIYIYIYTWECITINVYIYTYLHACMHTYMHACIHTSMHTYINAYIHTYVHTYIHTYIHTYMHTCIHAYMHTCIHAYMHTCIHTYIYIRHKRTFIYFPAFLLVRDLRSDFSGARNGVNSSCWNHREQHRECWWHNKTMCYGWRTHKGTQFGKFAGGCGIFINSRFNDRL